MDIFDYTGSSSIIRRITHILNRKAPLPLDGDGDPDWGTNGQVLSTDGSGNTAWVNAGGGGSGGHTIWNRIKSALTARSNLWFSDASVSDASADDATKVEVVTELLNETAFDNLATDGTADGIYTFPDSGGEYLTADMVGYDNTASGLSATDVQDAINELSHGISREFVSVTADGVKTNIQMLNELYALVDGTKVKCDSCLQIGNRTLQIGYISVGSYFMFQRLREVDSGNFYAIWDHVIVGSSSRYQTITAQPSASPPISIGASQGNAVLGNGTKYTLYY